MQKALTRADLKGPTLLLLLSLVPTLGGIMRLTNLSDDAAANVEHARFVAAPAPIAIHVLGATLYCLLGAFQFSAAFQRRFPAWHRSAGKLLAFCGLLAGATGVWMTVTYPIPAPMQGPVVYAVRLVVGTGMVAFILIGWWSILRRDVARHEAFMIRAYALGQGAGTQALVLLPWMLISGESGGLIRDLLMTLAWIINVIVAESIIKVRKKATQNYTRARIQPEASVAQ